MDRLARVIDPDTKIDWLLTNVDELDRKVSDLERLASRIESAEARIESAEARIERQERDINSCEGDVRDADVPAMWYFRIKKEWAAAKAENRPFVNPVSETTLHWRS